MKYLHLDVLNSGQLAHELSALDILVNIFRRSINKLTVYGSPSHLVSLPSFRHSYALPLTNSWEPKEEQAYRMLLE